MKTLQSLSALGLFLASAVILAGCGEAKKDAEPAAAPAVTPDATPDATAEPKTDENADADPAPAKEEESTSYTPKMSDDGETQVVALKLPNMT